MNTWLYRNPRMLALVVAMVVIAGTTSLLSLGRQEDPSITNLFASVVTSFPGADPRRVEALVTEKIESRLREIPEIDVITSTSRTGISVVSIELLQTLSEAAIEQAWSEIRDALDDAAVGFPAGVAPPEFDNEQTGAYALIAALVPRPGAEVGAATLRRYAELLRDQLRGVSGTRLVDLFGVREEEIRVTLDSRRLEALGLDAARVAAAISAADAKVRAGQIRGPQTDLLIELEGEIRSLARIREIPVALAADGGMVRVGDLGDVERGLLEPASSLALVDGEPGVLIAVRMQDGLQVDAWAERVRQRLNEFAPTLPASLEQRLLFDQSRYTVQRLLDVGANLLLGVMLVITVLLVALGWRAALVVAAILPLASLLSLTVLSLLGVPIHQMSVTGLIVALGLLVDAAIVMTDEIRRRLEAGGQRLAAIGDSVRRLALPLFASTLTTALAFAPMVLLPGPAGDFVGSIAMAVIVMLSASLVLAVTVAPALAGLLLRVDVAGKGPAWWHQGVRWSRLARGFGVSIKFALEYPRLAILGALVLPALGFAAFPTLKAQFFPGVDRNQFHVQLELREGSAIEATQAAVAAADRLLSASEGVRQVSWVIGESAPAFYYNMLMDRDGSPGFAEALVTTDSARITEQLLPILQSRLEAGVPAARVIVRGLVQGPPVDAPVELRLVGPDLAVLRELGQRLRQIMSTDPRIVQTRTQLQGGAPKLVLDLDEARVHAAGLDLSRIAAHLQDRLEGRVGGSLLEATEELPVRVRVPEIERKDTDGLRGLLLTTGNGTLVPLSALGELRLQPAETPIHRRNGERINTVQGFVQRQVLPEEALAGIRARLHENGFVLPPGYRLETGGDSDARADVVANLVASMGLILALTIATLVITFNSFRLAAITAVVAALSMGLSLLALALGGYPFGIQAVIGVIGSIGVSINAAIIIMTALQSDPAARAGDPDASRRVVMGAGRHIVSTTVTTFGGFLPLLLEGGGFWPPFAAAIAGGVLLSTVVSFYFTPPAFRLLARSGRVAPPLGTAQAAAA